jgi:PPK2 family polyphosphate:nucleotide phosphotransferase
MNPEKYLPKFGEKVSLADYDPDDNGGTTKTKAATALTALQVQMGELQERLYAEGTRSLLVVFQAMDAGGKDGAIKRVFEPVNPQGVRVVSFKRPSELELSHDFLWRVHQAVPPRGYMGIFNRSHYEDVLVGRVNQLAPADVIERRYDHINHFEALLADSGTRILKFFLYISKAEQKVRFEERLADPTKHWKFSIGDLPVREQWDDYMAAFETVFTRCHTPHAPWYIVPANKKWFRNLLVTQVIVSELERMNPQYPAPESGLDKITIPD